MVLEQFEHQINHNGASAVTQSLASRPTVVRKKFAKPPVKVACLACRASRTRCDGQDPCNNCLSKKRKCSYLPSKRGGPRQKKKPPVLAEDTVRQDGVNHQAIAPISPDFDDCMSSQSSPLNSANSKTAAAIFGQIDVLSAPGAGLRSLDFSSDVQSMFAGLFVPNDDSSSHAQMEPTPSSSSTSLQTVVRTYGSEHQILNAYYDFVHDYFPILPPRTAPPIVDYPLEGAGSFTESPSEEPVLVYRPRSPLSLAISAVLALVPHPNDPEPLSPSSIIRRRTYAHTFAQLATSSIESDCELHASSTKASEALSNARPLIDRESFHPQAPVELESILALLVLAVYEYTQRGNLLKMRLRADQALAIALDMSLQSLGNEYDGFAEARRRAWWMTYYCVLQVSIVSTTPLSIIANNPQFTTPYPRFPADPDGWSVLMQSQQVLVSATQYVIDLKECISTRADMSYIYERMQQLDAWASNVLARSNAPPQPSQPIFNGAMTERTTAQGIRAISRIKLSSAQIKIHRFRAFSDIPIFLKKHCDLTVANSINSVPKSASKTSERSEEISNIGCCSKLDQFQQRSPSEYTPSSTSSLPSKYQALPQYSFVNEFPYSCPHSARACLKASLVISQMFQNLPIPQPLTESGTPPQVLQLLPQNQYPRTMPSFACCLMQGSYALLMVYHKTRVDNLVLPGLGSAQASHPSNQFNEEFRQALERIIAAVTNYAVSSEALNGMKGDRGSISDDV
ncbi:hypothetical protein ASPCAL04438 [Aspergillus calidoustus]|uniref:Zn(2)-C6 fungal-type domain-containing protein n=1 Tax=Aspergillus calidoustus TaxID=454130 RepID=A0A0U5FUL6_ASPCI|nr:hypothetical protein ASPCAL04438 [Aspergillus calidoustus]